MKVMLLAWETPEEFSRRDKPEPEFTAYMGEWFAFSQGLAEKNPVDAGAALQPPETATTVSIRDGKRLVEDGPFPDTKEQLGGFFILDAPDLDTAAEWAKACPSANDGHVDVRVLPYLETGEPS